MRTAAQINRKTTRRIFFALGTVNSLTLYDDGAEEAVSEAVDRVHRLHDMLSAFDKNSEVGRINTNAGVSPVRVSDETLYLIKKSIRYSELTGGLFDITTKCLSDLWKRSIKDGHEPLDPEIEKALELTGHRDIIVDEKKKTVMLRKKGQSVDLGAIAKGYAADEVRRILSGHGVSDAIINLGGTVIALGEKTIGIQNPFEKTGVYFGKLAVKDRAVVTAGTYEQCRQTKDRLIHHIIDPGTGYPAVTSLRSVTLMGDSAEELDALSTAVLMMGIKNSLLLLKERGIEGAFVTREGNIYATDGMNISTLTAADPHSEKRSV